VWKTTGRREENEDGDPGVRTGKDGSESVCNESAFLTCDDEDTQNGIALWKRLACGALQERSW
jgi:hypothetical protein